MARWLACAGSVKLMVSNHDTAVCLLCAAQEVVGPFSYRKLSCKLDVWWDGAGHVSARVRG